MSYDGTNELSGEAGGFGVRLKERGLSGDPRCQALWAIQVHLQVFLVGTRGEAGILEAYPGNPSALLPGSAFKTLRYSPLRTEKEEIRLISLLESSSSLVECHIEHAALCAQPTYKALSYCWGDANETKEIIVNGCSTKVTANLEAALRRLRVREPRTFLWIDALCINQASVKERDRQVLRMRDIYSKAESIIAWIGEEDVSTASEIAFLDSVAHGEEQVGWDMWSPCQQSILRRPYWRRTWIVQEICLAKDVQIVTGSQAFWWDILRMAVQRTTGSYHHSDRDAYAKEAITQLVNIRKSLENGCEVKLLDVLNRTVLLKATDTRDKMYGLLGLTRDGPSIVPSPNYDLAVNTVVKSAMRAIAASETTLDVLAAKMAFEEPHPNSPMQDMVITHGIQLDGITSALDLNRPDYYGRHRYTSAQEVFAALDLCLFPMEYDSSDYGRHLKTAFASDIPFSPDAPWAVLDSTSTRLFKLNEGLIVSGQTLKDWAKGSYSYKHLPTRSDLENERYKDYFSKVNRLHGDSNQNTQQMIVTRDGRLGLVHPNSQAGDMICLLHAFHNIVILRPWEDGYKIVGYAHIDGYVRGQMDWLLRGGRLMRFHIY
ncbi:Heterokaryon incompatibility protein (HET) domain containing protein [Hyaloscypha variabilis]